MRKIRLRRKNDVKFLNENKGITLVALIVTIIVMLVLAGVSMNAIIGDNGIVNQAINAKEGVEEAELWEQIQTILVEAYAEDLEEDEFVEYCNNKFDSQNLAAIIRRSENNDNWSYVLTYGIYSRYIAYLNLDLSIYQTVAAVESTSEYWNYDYNDDETITLTAYKGSDTEITIPNIVDGYLVTALGTQIFMYHTEITAVTFSEGLETIESKAFSSCSNLEIISNFPSTLVTIGDEAFYGCSSLSSTITFGSSITSVGSSSFYNCSNMNGTVENLIRTSVSYGLYAFYGCSSLSGDVSTAMSAFLTDDDTEIPDYLFSGWSGLTGTITIGSNIERIGQYAFYGCSGITGIDISGASSLVTIDKYAFHNCSNMGADTNYSELDFSSYCTNLTTIGTHSFSGDSTGYGTKITTVTIPSNVTTIGDGCFYICRSLTTVTLDSNGEYGNSIFEYCANLKSITFGSNFKLTILPEEMFASCFNITSISIPSTITTIDSSCFSGCTKLQTVTFSSILVTIGSGAFSSCSSLTTLPLTFDGDELISTLTTISDKAFYNCSILGKTNEDETTDIIDLLENSNVITLGNDAFYGCAYLDGDITDSTIYNITGTVKISQGAGVFTGTGVTSQKTFTLANSTKIADSEFQGTTKFVVSSTDDTEVYTIEIPEGVTSIGDYAFDGCTSITKVIIPYTVTSIGKYAFYNCTALIEVVGQDNEGTETEEITGVTTLGTYCFAYCSSLTNVGTFSSVENIPTYCWSHCEALTSFTFWNALERIDGYAFNYTGLETINFETTSSLSFGTGVFQYTNLETVELPEGVTGLPNLIFQGCTKLKSVICPSSCTSLYQSPFGGCTALEYVDVRRLG